MKLEKFNEFHQVSIEDVSSLKGGDACNGEKSYEYRNTATPTGSKSVERQWDYCWPVD